MKKQRFIKPIKYKFFDAVYNGQKVPRKQKKNILGIKMSSCALNRLKKSVKINVIPDDDRPSYPTIEVLPYEFCPECGETGAYCIDHGVEYPEIWQTWKCLRCNAKVASADNSPTIHVLQQETYANL